MQLINHTPFSGAAFVDMDHHGSETLVLAMKATYEFGGAEKPRLAPAQDDLVFSDLYAGEPGASSLLYESDANWGRQATDIALMAHAYPQRESGRETDVTLRVGALVKTAHVFGDRTWSSAVGGWQISPPQPFKRIPLIYERAFGGTDDSPEHPGDLEGEDRNPVGRGLRARKSRKPVDATMLPNIEDPRNLISGLADRPAPVGFTFVAKSWKPRRDYAGTYNAAWQRDRMPLLPKDFDPTFYTAASDGLSAPLVRGGELVDLINLTPTRREQFVLPTLAIHAAFHIDAAPTPLAMRLDTIVIDAVNTKLVMVWRGSHPVPGLVDDVRWVLAEGGAV
jgi:hypothetical protein